MSLGRDAFKLAFEISPIILTGGVASSIPGGMLPIISITEAANFVTGLLSGGGALDLDRFFAHFVPIPGGTLVDNAIGEYPFANQQVAANAIIVGPRRISLRMICPSKSTGGYAAKLATFTALEAVIARHNISGGTYTVATPAFLYTDLVMLSLRDATTGETKQAQSEWQWDFKKPIVTSSDAQQAQNSLMSKISAGTPFDSAPTWSGLPPSVGLPSSGVAPSIVPALTPLAGGAVSGIGR